MLGYLHRNTVHCMHSTLGPGIPSRAGGEHSPARLSDGDAGPSALDGPGIGAHHVQARASLARHELRHISRDVHRVSRSNGRSWAGKARGKVGMVSFRPFCGGGQAAQPPRRQTQVLDILLHAVLPMHAGSHSTSGGGLEFAGSESEPRTHSTHAPGAKVKSMAPLSLRPETSMAKLFSFTSST